MYKKIFYKYNIYVLIAYAFIIILTVFFAPSVLVLVVLFLLILLFLWLTLQVIISLSYHLMIFGVKYVSVVNHKSIELPKKKCKIKREEIIFFKIKSLLLSVISAIISVQNQIYVSILIFILIGLLPKKQIGAGESIMAPVVIDQNGKILIEPRDMFDEQVNTHVTIPISNDEVPEEFFTLLLVQEDRDFKNQNNIMPKWNNWNGISIRAFFTGILKGEGGSNINMQLVKNLCFKKGAPRDIQRKFYELLMSYHISRTMNVEEILNKYINNIPFHGEKEYDGLFGASYNVFGRPPKELNQLEQYYLIRSVRRGRGMRIGINDKRNGNLKYLYSRYSDAHNYPLEIKEYELKPILKKYINDGLISEKLYSKMINSYLNFSVKTKIRPLRGPTRHFLNDLIVTNKNGLPLRYNSTINKNVQDIIENTINSYLNQQKRIIKKEKGEIYELKSAVIVADIKKGYVYGHYGGSDPRVDLTNFQNGNPIASLIKPFIFLQYLEGQYSENMSFYDGPLKKLKTPKNADRPYTNRYLGISDILIRSLNAPTVNVRDHINTNVLINDLEKNFKRIGIKADKYALLSEGEYYQDQYNYFLGSRNMTLYNIAQIYQVLFNGGEYVRLSPIISYYDPYLSKEIKYHNDSKRIFDYQNAKYIKDILSKVISTKEGTLHFIKNILPENRKYYGKTGTSEKSIHAYAVISDDRFMIAVQLTYTTERSGIMFMNDNQPVYGGSKNAGKLAASIYRDILPLLERTML